MSKTEIEHSETSDDAGDEHDHPSDNKYIQIAIILAVITALEVATYFFEGMPGEISNLLI